MIGLSQAHKQFVDHLQSKSRASATILAYGKDIEQLVQFLEGLKYQNVQGVKAEDIAKFLGKLQKENYTLKSVSRKLNSIKTFFRYLKVANHITDDPASLVPHPKFETKPPRILTPLEYRALRDVCRDDARTYAIVEILLQTGIRISELANLRLEDVVFPQDATEGYLNIKPQEGRGERQVPQNKAVEAALKHYLEVRPDTGKDVKKHLFVTKTGRQLLVRNIRSAIDRYFRKAGIVGAKVNDLRHTWIAHHLQRGVSVVLVSKLAGHKRLSTTERYLSLLKERSKEEKVKLEEL